MLSVKNSRLDGCYQIRGVSAESAAWAIIRSIHTVDGVAWMDGWIR